MSDADYMSEWKSICEAYCKKTNAKLMFVNMDNFGVEDADGTFRHIYADELMELIEALKKNNSGKIPRDASQ